MIYDMYITEIANGVYGATIEYHGQIMHTSLIAKSAKDAEKTARLRFSSQRYILCEKHSLPAWNKFTDKFKTIWRKSSGLNIVPAPNDQQKRLYEVLEKTDNGHLTFEIKKHEHELLTEEEVKLAIFERAVNQ